MQMNPLLRTAAVGALAMADAAGSAQDVTLRILTEEQIARYNALRGYGSHDPCGAVPEGHDLAMWRSHNGCD